ncbi:MAG: hypothetical protein IPL66_09355 [Dehalococcoidia bacterium]|nr:hypothetical protein [Dehalococcoidia bacterium]
MQYLRARYYDPETGTFLSREPLAKAPSWLGNPTAYAAGNPARLSDPLEHVRVTRTNAAPEFRWFGPLLRSVAPTSGLQLPDTTQQDQSAADTSRTSDNCRSAGLHPALDRRVPLRCSRRWRRLAGRGRRAGQEGSSGANAGG